MGLENKIFGKTGKKGFWTAAMTTNLNHSDIFPIKQLPGGLFPPGDASEGSLGQPRLCLYNWPPLLSSVTTHTFHSMI